MALENLTVDEWKYVHQELSRNLKSFTELREKISDASVKIKQLKAVLGDTDKELPDEIKEIMSNFGVKMKENLDKEETLCTNILKKVSEIIDLT